MRHIDIKRAIAADGLRIVIAKAMPSAWGIAAKAMMEFKGLDFSVAYHVPRGDNLDLLTWSGVNSAPVVAWNKEPPINRWNDILFLLERLAPDSPLVPQAPEERMRMLGLSHEICGELGFGWNRRLGMLRPTNGAAVSAFGLKYGYRDTDAKNATPRVIAFMRELACVLKSQRTQGSQFLVGNSVTAADFYWAAFSNFVVIQSAEECPINPAARPMFENTPAEITEAIDLILIDHRDFIMQTYYKLPLEL
ncbi:MAG: hypothetical protein OSA42_09065 [Porticoccaceae bacterium]|nr:hypothetical protein [Porticoccaceae bacterium]